MTQKVIWHPNTAPSFFLLYVITNEKTLKLKQIASKIFPAETRKNSALLSTFFRKLSTLLASVTYDAHQSYHTPFLNQYTHKIYLSHSLDTFHTLALQVTINTWSMHHLLWITNIAFQFHFSCTHCIFWPIVLTLYPRLSTNHWSPMKLHAMSTSPLYTRPLMPAAESFLYWTPMSVYCRTNPTFTSSLQISQFPTLSDTWSALRTAGLFR